MGASQEINTASTANTEHPYSGPSNSNHPRRQGSASLAPSEPEEAIHGAVPASGSPLAQGRTQAVQKDVGTIGSGIHHKKQKPTSQAKNKLRHPAQISNVPTPISDILTKHVDQMREDIETSFGSLKSDLKSTGTLQRPATMKEPVQHKEEGEAMTSYYLTNDKINMPTLDMQQIKERSSSGDQRYEDKLARKPFELMTAAPVSQQLSTPAADNISSVKEIGRAHV